MSQPSTSHFRLSAQLVLGLVLAGLGILFTLDNLNILEAERILRYWPAAMVVLGVVQITRAQSSARIVSGTIWILVGGAMLGVRLHLLPRDIWDYWPVILVLIGGYIVWQGLNRGAVTPGDPSDKVSVLAVMGGGDRRVVSRAFQGGELTAIMGGGKVDMREATMAGPEIVLDVFTLMGGFEVDLPDNWNVVVEVVAFMGGCEDKTRRPADPSAPRLIIRGFVMMGGVEFRN